MSGTAPGPWSAWLLDGWAAFAIGLALVTLSAEYVRLVPERVTYNNECLQGPDPEACYEPRLGGGLPLAFLLDTPGASVEGQVSWGEATFLEGRFWLDLGVWWALALAALKALHRRRPPRLLWRRWRLRFLAKLGVLLTLGTGVALLHQVALEGNVPGWLLPITWVLILPVGALLRAVDPWWFVEPDPTPLAQDPVPEALAVAVVIAAGLLWLGGWLALWVRRPGSSLQGPR